MRSKIFYTTAQVRSELSYGFKISPRLFILCLESSFTLSIHAGWWHEFLPKWNGICLLELHSLRPTIQLWIGASGNWIKTRENCVDLLGDIEQITGPRCLSKRISTRKSADDPT